MLLLWDIEADSSLASISHRVRGHKEGYLEVMKKSLDSCTYGGESRLYTWRLYRYRRSPHGGDTPPILPATHRLYNGSPTWSWASVKDRVEVRFYPNLIHRPVSEVLGASVDIVDAQHPFEQIKGGKLRLRAKLTKVPYGKRITDGYYLMHRYFSINSLLQVNIGECTWDGSTIEPPQRCSGLQILQGIGRKLREVELNHRNQNTIPNLSSVLFLIENESRRIEYFRVGSGRIIKGVCNGVIAD